MTATHAAVLFLSGLGLLGCQSHPMRADRERGARHSLLELVAYGCAGNETRVARTPGVRSAGRVEYRHGHGRGELSEWYAQTARGVEQGFTLDHPACAGEVVFDVSTGDFTPRLTDDGAAVELLDSSGALRLHYSNLSARDASGRELPATLAVAIDRITIRVAAQNATYPVVVDPLLWAQQAVLLAGDGAPGDQFGSAVALDGDTAIVGANEKQIGASVGQGAAYVFVRSGTAWAQQGPALLASDGAQNDVFGSAVALSGNTAVVGANNHGHSLPGNLNGGGAAYVFVRSGASWAQQGPPLVDGNGAASNDQFGYSVAVEGDTAAFGAPEGGDKRQGAAYVFVRSGTSWAQQGPALEPDDGAISDAFGVSLALDGDTIAIGAPDKSLGSGRYQGAAYVFVRSGATWLQQGPALTPSDARDDAAFGSSVALSGDTLVIGASNGGNNLNGVAYVFTRTGSIWTQQGAPIAPSDPSPLDTFGLSVALSGDKLVVAAANNVTAGAYLFQRGGNTWTQQGARFAISNGVINGGHLVEPGYLVALSADTAVVGAYAENAAQGEAFVWASPVGAACNGPADCAGQSCVDGVCCDAACAGACDVCKASLGALADGVCTVLPAGSAGSPACGPFVCNGVSASCTTCAHDSECTPGRYCGADGTCHAQEPLGGGCDETPGNACLEAGCAVCASGHCADGVCCNSACGGACDVCSSALGASADGTCSLAPLGSAGAPACANGAACNGASATCPLTCSSDSDCASDHYCAANGACLSRKALGSICDQRGGADCKLADCRVCVGANNCVDGVCCDAPCSGACDVCTKSLGASADGTCTILGKGAPGQPACAAGATCDGTQPVCPGAGCKSDADCPTGDACESNGECVVKPPLPGHCNGDRTQELGPDGGLLQDCGRYRCVVDTCRSNCTTDADCSNGNHCDLSANQCVAGASTADGGGDASAGTSGAGGAAAGAGGSGGAVTAAGAGGCGCRTTTAPARGDWFATLSLVALMGAWRRRSRRTR
jgi:hypothetical protein